MSGQVEHHLLELAENKRQKNRNLKCLYLAPIQTAEKEHRGSFSFVIKGFELIPFHPLLSCTVLLLWGHGCQESPLALLFERGEDLAF